MTDVMPAALKRSTASWTSEFVVAVSLLPDATVTTVGVTPDLLEVGQQVLVEGVLVAGPVADDHAHLGRAAQQLGAVTPLDQRGQHGGVVGPGPPQVGRAQLRPLRRGRPRRDHRGLPLLGDAELVVPAPRPEAVHHGERRGAPLGPVLAERLHARLVLRVELHDDRVDLAAVDPAGVVDLVHVEVDRLGLLAVLDVLREAELSGLGVEVDDREHHVDGVRRHAACAGAGL